jgi:hypothetical protein
MKGVLSRPWTAFALLVLLSGCNSPEQSPTASATASLLTTAANRSLAGTSSTVAIPSTEYFSTGSAWTIFDTNQSSSPGCKPFLDAQITPITFPESDGTRIQFQAADFRGNNYIISGTLSNSGAISGLKTNCQSALSSPLNSNSNLFTGGEWLTSFFKLDQSHIVGVVHNEFYGGDFPESGQTFSPSSECPSGIPSSCLYSAVTSAISDDSGNTFNLMETPFNHVIARPGFPYSPSYGSTTGYFINTNILQNSDGYYYMMLLEEKPNAPASICPVRTNNPTVPSSWRAWNGSAYESNVPGGANCSGVSVGIAPFYLGYSTFFTSFITVGSALTSPFHFSYSLSSDLIHCQSQSISGSRRAGPREQALQPTGEIITILP